MLSMKECLLKKTFDQIYDLAFRLMVDPPEGRNKQVWAEAVEREMLSIPLQELRLFMPLSYWKLIRKEAIPDPDDPGCFMVPLWVVNTDDKLESALYELERMALARRDRQKWHLQPLVMKAAAIPRNALSRYKACDGLADLLNGILHWYGAAPGTELLRLVGGDQTDDTLPEAEQLDHIADLWRMRYGFCGVHVVDRKTLWLTAPYCEDAEKLIVSQLSPDTAKLPYKPLTPGEITSAALNGFPEHGSAYDPLRGMLCRVMDADETDELLESVIIEMQNGCENAGVELLANALPDTPAPTQMKLIGEFFEQIPLWRLKGHTVAELRGREKRSAMPKKVSRTDFCPCGSGRRYGHCCGRLN